MESLAAQINRARVPEGGVAVWWLAQAGFVFKTVSDAILYVDPYLSNVVEKAFGFKRLLRAMIGNASVSRWSRCSCGLGSQFA